MRVRATQLGFYGNDLRRPGEEFNLRSPKDFTSKWMEKVEQPPKQVDKPKDGEGAKDAKPPAKDGSDKEVI